jgi:hypothetical protein
MKKKITSENENPKNEKSKKKKPEKELKMGENFDPT